jgi:hypothetical protein
MNTKIFTVLVFVVTSALRSGSAQTWEQIAPPLSMNYPCLASSADGTTLLVSGFRLSIPIYLSTNSGAAWTTTSAPLGTWDSFAISADGAKFVAANYDPQGIYTSADGGITWFSNNVPRGGWTSVAASADGRRLVAVNNSPQTIYLSTNGGALWTQATTAPLAIWRSVASSADGTRLVAVNSYPGTIYTSNDGGTDWVRCTNVPAATWVAVASSADGARLVAAANPGPVYTSIDSGITWELGTLPNTSWRACAASADATTFIVSSQSGFIYTTVDSSGAWKSNTVPARSWSSVAASADGSQLFAVADGANGGLWRLSNSPTPRLQAALSPGSFRLDWVLPSIKFVLQQSPDCASASWKDVTNAPTLNLSNLRYQIELPMLDRSFYRLKSQ